MYSPWLKFYPRSVKIHQTVLCSPCSTPSQSEHFPGEGSWTPPVPSPYFSIWSISTNLFSENCEHLKNFRNVDCVLANYNKVQDAQANLKPQTNYRCCWRFSYLVPYWLISRNTITIHKYSWCSRFCEFHSKCYF